VEIIVMLIANMQDNSLDVFIFMPKIF